MRTKLRNGIQCCGIVLLIAVAALSGWWTSAVVRGNRHVRQATPVPAVQHFVPQPPDQVTNDKQPQPSKTACRTVTAPFAVPGMSPFLSCGPLY